MKIQRIETKAFAVSVAREKSLEKRLSRNFAERLLRKTVLSEETRLVKAYRPLAKFKVTRMVEAHKGVMGEKTIYESKENNFYVDLSNADLYIEKKGKIDKLDVIQRLLDVSPAAVGVYGELLRTGYIYAEKLDKGALMELARQGFITAYKSTFLMFFKGIWAELNPEEQKETEVKERVKASFKIPNFNSSCYDLGNFFLEIDEMDESYAKDKIRYPPDIISEILSRLFGAEAHLIGVSFMPYVSARYEKAKQGKAKSPKKEYPLASLKAKRSQIKPGVRLKSIALSTAIGSSGSVPLEASTIDFSEVGGMADVKKEIEEALICPLTDPALAKEFGKKCGGAILFYGPPGCGKSYIARATIGEVGVPFFNVNISEIVGKGVEAEAESLHKVFSEAAKNSPAVIFFDELDAIGGRRKSGTSYGEKMEVDQFLMEMDGVESLGDDILIIAATNAPWNIDPALRRSVRFTKHIFINPPGPEERREIFKVHLKGKPVADNLNLEELAALTEDYSSSDIKAICDLAAEIPWEEALESGKGRKIEMSDLLCAIEKQPSSLIPWFKLAYDELKSSGEENLFSDFSKYIIKYGGGLEKAKDQGISFLDVGGMAGVKEEIKKLIVYPFKDLELFNQYKKELGGSLLLYGPPGCGKTHIARASAGEAEVSFFNVTLTDVLSNQQGASEKNIHDIFEKASRNTPAILFFDEIDAITGRRDRAESESGRRLVDAFLTELDGFDKTDGLIVIAATNAPWNIDPALRRAGRFTKQIFIPSPGIEERCEIFKVHLKDKPVTDDLDYYRLAEMTPGYAGSDIKAVCDRALELVWQEALEGGAKRKVSMADFLVIIPEHRSSIIPWYLAAEKQLEASGEQELYPALVKDIRDFRTLRASYSEDAFQELLEEEKDTLGIRPGEKMREIEAATEQKEELERRIELAREKFHKREIDEQTFKELIRGYEKELIESDVKLEILKGRAEKEQIKTEIQKREPLAPGRVYILEESRIDRSARIFMDETRDRPGFWVSRTDPDGIELEYESGERDLIIKRLMDLEHEGSAPSDVSHLFFMLSDFIDLGGSRVILIEGLAYMVSKNGFDSVLRFIQGLNDKIDSTEVTVIVSIMPETLSEQQRSLLEKEAEVI